MKLRFQKKYIYSSFQHRDRYQRTKSSCIYKPINILPNILKEKDTYSIIEEVVIGENLAKSNGEKETKESKEELNTSRIQRRGYKYHR